MTPQRVTLITLGCRDLPAARAFYARLGWQEHGESQPGVAFFQMHQAALALFGSADLAEDQGRAGAALGVGAATLAQNFATEAEVDAAFAAALAAGGTALKPPAKVFWGGYSGYWADLDGHVWEVARNPFWPLSAEGALTLPGAAETIPEDSLTPTDEAQIVSLLDMAFPTEFDGRSFFQTRHHWRHVIRDQGRIVAHIAVQLRAARLGDRLITLAGLAEVATDPAHRGKGHAATLVRAAIDRAAGGPAQYVALFGNAALYAAAGFQPAANPLIRVDMTGARTGDVRREAADSLMILPLRGAVWDASAPLDLLGPGF